MKSTYQVLLMLLNVISCVRIVVVSEMLVRVFKIVFADVCEFCTVISVHDCCH